MTFRKEGIPALIVTCAFAMFAVAAIPTHAHASSYYNGVDVSLCVNTFCGDYYTYGDDVYGGSMYLDGFGREFHSQSVYNRYPVVYRDYVSYRGTAPNYRRTQYWPYQHDFNRDVAIGTSEWDAHAAYYNALPF